MDLEQAAASSISIVFNTVAVRPHKDFGVLTVPARLRVDPGRQADLGWWTQIGFGFICTFGEYAVINMLLTALTYGSGCQSLLLSTSPE